ncbi:MAG TPA: hypothetical protein VMV77_04185 [Bacteroidales bacterium]|nr:hypothetical protein [Bacteroidales bacterium]
MSEKNNQEKIRELHECNSELYKLIDRLKTINVPVGLGFQNLRDATMNIQKAIGALIDQETNTNEEKET